MSLKIIVIGIFLFLNSATVIANSETKNTIIIHEDAFQVNEVKDSINNHDNNLNLDSA
jgi:hypothetical protein